MNEILKLIQNFDEAFIKFEKQDESIMISNSVTCDDKSISETAVWIDIDQAKALKLWLERILK